MSISPRPQKARPSVRLEPINLHNAADFEELLQQRVLCGWGKTPSVLQGWRNAMDETHKALFWIHLQPVTSGDAATSPPVQRIGHIGFQSVPDIGAPDSDLEIANTDKTTLMISSFFVLEEHRGGGVGRAAMEALEAMTQVPPYGSPRCHTLTLHTLSRAYIEDDDDGSPDGWRLSRGLWAKLGEKVRPRGSANEDWYTRMGYVKWKQEPRYEETLVDGSKFLLMCVFMRKKVSSKGSLEVSIE